MFKRVMSLSTLAALLLIASPDAASAQNVSVTPFVGYYAPLGTLLKEGATEIGTEGAMMFGGRLGLATPGKWSFEGTVAYSGAGLEDVPEDGSVTILGARALYQLATLGTAGSLHAGAGLAYVMRGGEFWDAIDEGGIEGINDFGGTVGLSARFPLGPSMTLRLDVEDYIYSGEIHDDTDATESQLQNDVLLSAGLSFGF